MSIVKLGDGGFVVYVVRDIEVKRVDQVNRREASARPTSSSLTGSPSTATPRYSLRQISPVLEAFPKLLTHFRHQSTPAREKTGRGSHSFRLILDPSTPIQRVQHDNTTADSFGLWKCRGIESTPTLLLREQPHSRQEYRTQAS